MVLAAAAGCAPTNVKQQSTDMTATQLPRPALVLVYDFAVSPDEVQLDTGLSADIMQKYQEHKVADALAEELVKKIRSCGLWAERGFGYPHGNSKDLMIKGQLLSIDEGNRTERVAIGLGAGRTRVKPM